MEVSEIIKAAFCTVGTVQMSKKFIKTKHSWVYVLLTIMVGTIYSLPIIPDWVLSTILVVSASTLFYDTIYKAFEKSFTHIKKIDSNIITGEGDDR